MNGTEIASFSIRSQDHVKGFVGAVHVAVVVEDSSHGGSLFLQVDQSAQACLKMAEAFLGLAHAVIEKSFRLMDHGRDFSDDDARAIVELARLAMLKNPAGQSELVFMVDESALVTATNREAVHRAWGLWSERK